ncbi:hypothetical protein AB0N05_15035 [Nocardia sp. NPDC051030]|uniref:hypothetical protein n=1 Tax=Nocardia sp. NPDC051030 TaxID=3155162 RepID=UPI00343B73D6
MTNPDRVPMCRCGCGGPGDFSRGMCAASYNQYRRRQIAYGRWRPRVPVDAAREHVAALVAAGLRPAQVADLAGISRSTVFNITDPDTGRIQSAVERAVLAVAVPERPADVTADNALVPILGASRRIQALVAHGYPQSHLARELGIDPAHTTMAALVGRPNRAAGATGQTLTAKRERAIRELFDRLQMTPGPSDRARDYGRRHGWPLPFEWDEDSIDRRDARPIRARWTPASTKAERREQVRTLTGLGLAASQIAEQLGVTKRAVQRDRQLAALATSTPAELDWGLDR